jgi:hypothetical protein
MIGFIILGAGLSATIGLFIGLLFTADIKSWSKWIATILIALVVGFLIAGLIVGEAKGDEAVWNDGHCECGGEWDFTNAEHLRNGGNLYYYVCKDCGDLIRTHRYFK